ncbi:MULTISPECIES: lysine N(6)-hydroxylase/L-ornithine N(5)-oxygenase family protein [Halobacterium]|uniref:Monooxygenase n=5 Tax=Halobacterium salinarum TaxID=2242 RepID=Q9HHV0_HALSA|nr:MULTISPECIES: lysine N(6)-hydroxylase/L-ornithine N(5)-oxygenase family protein [Halobacterium]AAG20876.1 monooxygenase [Halobacterium salinarum NRC-1]MBB6090614.1 lysine N6-hydroxylase [Halobacterium salinarum]MCF2207598.1 lysine N(6)-hydroxylase/L-ornithine N(5)-oxygenase family protein [Halobacterium salinarum]MDL0119967.1 lysine N(6)-hydroxylase/L-ornithine N(5)-oxygenase family protein [Halobacterium salinarum]MDL0121272.1 lysine N(6)-hydroxylase/L-ornithine N(5)-oxygenase family prote
MTESVHDLVGVGLGPFNLGLAALIEGSDDVPLDAAFLEQKPEFVWHDGMLIEGTTLEVPFLADLVTLADPTNPYSYLNYLREHDRLYEFYFYETFQIPRREYNDYCQWVAESLAAPRFSRRVVDITAIDDDATPANFRVTAVEPADEARSATDDDAPTHQYRARDLVVGVGSRPYVPPAFRDLPAPDVFHTAAYREHRAAVCDADSVAVIGSGQSAAEVVHDLLTRRSTSDRSPRVDWVTRSAGFFPMEYSKLGLQHFTPEYTDYVYDLPQPVKDELIPNQDILYKGIDPETSTRIYDTLYEQSIGGRDPNVGMIAATEVGAVEPTGGGRYRVDCRHRQTDTGFAFETDAVILGTGYHRPTPGFLSSLEPRLARDDQDRLAVDREYGVGGDLPGGLFVQNAELHTHGVGAPDLGLGAYRNAVILDRLLADAPYPVDRDTVFQDFAPEAYASHAPGGRVRDDDPTTPPAAGQPNDHHQ